MVIPAGAASITIPLPVTDPMRDNQLVVISLVTGQPAYHVGCPSQSLIAIDR